jgi:hypothetical protein
MKAMAMTLLFLVSLTAFAQDQTTTVDENQPDPKAKERIKAARAAYITERLELTSSEAEKFWPIYHEFAEKRETMYQKLREARKSGGENKSTLDLYHKTRQEELDLEKSYSSRFLQVISAEKLLKLHQAEKDFRKVMLRHVQRRNKMEGRDGRKKELKNRR